MCKTEKPVEEFPVHNGTKDRLHSLCRICKNASQKKYMNSQKGKDTIRMAHLRRSYGITQEQYDEILTAQGGGCAICGTKTNPDKRASVFAIDHCHKTGRIRGLLCSQCNALLGLAKDTPEILELACRYLKRFYSHKDCITEVQP